MKIINKIILFIKNLINKIFHKTKTIVKITVDSTYIKSDSEIIKL